MADPVLLTTSVGSFPKPDYITKARAEASRGKMPRSELQELEQRATEEWIRFHYFHFFQWIFWTASTFFIFPSIAAMDAR